MMRFPPVPNYGRWAHHWADNPPERQRDALAHELGRLRRRYGTREARDYRDHLRWIDAYPKQGEKP